MNYIEKREFIYSHLHQVDEKAIDDMFNKMSQLVGQEDIIVGYEVDGSPISKKDLKDRVKEASARVKAGDYISQEELEKEVRAW